MKRYIFPFLNVLLSFSLIGPSVDSYAAGEITAEQLIERHLQSLGEPAALANAQSRGFVGISTFEVILGGVGRPPLGSSMLASEGGKLGISMKYDDREYPGEYFAFDGKEVSVFHISPGVKSPLAQFVYRFDDIIREGLLGGALSTSWALLKIDKRQPRILKYDVREIEGRRLHELTYLPKDGLGNMKIELYFDWETFRHVRTEYLVRIHDDLSLPPAGLSIMEVVPEYRYHLIEKFDNFVEVAGITMPQSYSIDYSAEEQNYTFIGRWSMEAKAWIVDKSFDERIFQAEK